MQVVTVLAVALLAAVSVSAAPSDATNFYDGHFDHFDIDTVLNNDKLLTNYINCILANNDKKCTREGKDLKRILPEALETTCAKCSPAQAARIRKVCKVVMQKHPDKWEELSKKFDEEGKYKKSFDEFLAKKD